MFKEVFRHAMKFAISHLKGATPDVVDRALDIISPIFVEMIGNLIASGQATASAEFRKPYEEKALRVLREAGIVEDF